MDYTLRQTATDTEQALQTGDTVSSHVELQAGVMNLTSMNCMNESMYESLFRTLYSEC